MPDYALSIKQPWATLLAHGLKTIEVRRWSTARRGRVFIHAARVADDRPEGWAHLPPDIKPETERRGGIIAVAQLTGCVRYAEQSAFDADRARHLNEPGWFEEPELFGFTFSEPRLLSFQACPGWFRFFRVPETLVLTTL